MNLHDLLVSQKVLHANLEFYIVALITLHVLANADTYYKIIVL